MIVSHRLRIRHVLQYSWPSLLYFLLLSATTYVLHHIFFMRQLTLPFGAVTVLSAALGIYLGFKANQAYERWWEGRKIWGLVVNFSRAFGRELLTFLDAKPDEREALAAWQHRVLYRHIAWVHGLRVFLREPNGYVRRDGEPLSPENTYDDLRDFLEPSEMAELREKRNPPNWLMALQGEALREAHDRGWVSDYRFVQMSQTLTEFNNHQGMAERIKNTPLPRPFSVYSRVFVLVHGTMVPSAFIESLGWMNIPLSLAINFVFLTLDEIGKQVEDPFENRIADVPLTAISVTIEENLKEIVGDPLPEKPPPMEGVVF